MAATCCFRRGFWHRNPAPITLSARSRIHAASGCYLAHLKTCEGPLSQEHLISEAVLNVIKRDGLRVSGLPWIPRGTSKMLPATALVARCLCKEHNSDLSDLDAEAARFFAALQGCDAQQAASALDYMGSGHDLERWLLKTLAAMAYSGNFAHPGGGLGANFLPSLDISKLLEEPDSWPAGAGLYATARIGDGFVRSDTIVVAPLFREGREGTEEIVGLYLELQGFRFDFFPVPPTVLGLQMDLGPYRLGRIEVTNSEARHVLNFSWGGAGRHGVLQVAAVPKPRRR